MIYLFIFISFQSNEIVSQGQGASSIDPILDITTSRGSGTGTINHRSFIVLQMNGVKQQ